MLRKIHLHGALAEKFAPSYELAVETPIEAVRAIAAQVRGFEQDVRAGEFVCIRGGYDTGIQCDEELLYLNLGTVRDFHIIPAAVGAGHGGGTKILLGVAMIGAALITGGASLIANAAAAGATLGAGAAAGVIGGALAGSLGLAAAASAWGLGIGALLIVGGISRALSPSPQGNTAGYLFNGAVNTNQQGGACPLVFGRLICGSIVVSAGIDAERISSNYVGATTDPGNQSSEHYGDVTTSEGPEGELTSSQVNSTLYNNPSIISTSTLAEILAKSSASSE